MTRYHWDLNKIKGRIKIIEQTIEATQKHPNNIYAEYIIQNLTQFKDLYHFLLHYYSISKTSASSYDPPFYNSTVGKAEKMIEESPKEKLNSFLFNSHTISKSLINISTNGLNYTNGYSIAEVNPSPLYINNQDLLELFNDFIHQMGSPSLFHKIDQEKTHIELNIQKAPNYFYSMDGCCFDDYLFNEKYINIFRSNTIKDMVTLCHEFFHGFYSNLNLKYTNRNELCYFSELEGSFANLLVAEYYRQLGQEENAYYIDSTYLENYILRNFELNIGFLLAKQKRKFTLERFNKKLQKKNIEITFTDRDEIFEYLTEPASLLLCYNLSYLASLDLFELYQKDREKAFVKLEKIKEMDYHQHLIRLSKENGFTFMEKDCPSLQKHLKKLEKSKKDMSLS
ncbi:MAG TPA: hypothetical protein IAB56_04230 [Candidatus Scybalousia intestinigallinarum]|nr:hypothetical protein [Candidatus Scybalousia intestinigallinarum]